MISLLGDVHIGARNASKQFSEFFAEFFEKEYIPFLVKNEIHDILCLGDLFDVRKFTNHYALFEAKKYLFDLVTRHDINFHVLVGNHDIFYRESLQINAPSLLLDNYNRVKVYDKPTTLKIDGNNFDIIPWICKENEAEVLNFIKESSSDYACVHGEIEGFAMYKGVIGHGGVSPKLFERYVRTFSGHYHTRSEKGNITYVGTPYEMTWQDCGDLKGYHTFDATKNNLIFYPNPYSIFLKFVYTDDLTEPDFSIFTRKYIKLLVLSRKDILKFEAFVQKINDQNPYELKIIEEVLDMEEAKSEDHENIENTLHLLDSFVNKIETQEDKPKIQEYLKSLYLEAITLE